MTTSETLLLQYYIVARVNIYMPIGTIFEGYKVDPNIAFLCDGRVLRKDEFPELFMLIGQYYTRSEENWLQRWARRIFKLPPDIRDDEFRIPYIKNGTATWQPPI